MDMQNEVYRKPSPNPEDQLCIHCKWHKNPKRSTGEPPYCLVVRDKKNLVTGENIVDLCLMDVSDPFTDIEIEIEEDNGPPTCPGNSCK